MANELEIRVPVAFRRGIEAIRKWQDEEFEAAIDALDALAPNTATEHVIDSLVSAVPSTSTGAARGLLNFVTQMRSLPARTGVGVDVAASAIARASEDLAEDTDELERLSSRLERLLSTTFISLREKVQRLQREPEPRFERARYIVDLRPVFDRDGTDDEPQAVGVALVGTLSIELDGDHRDRSVSMRIDRPGLAQLQGVIERALKKHHHLDLMLVQKELSNLTFEDD